MKKQNAIIIFSLIGIGSLFGGVYATSISDTGITTPACNGCVSEQSFSTYSLVINKTISGSTDGGVGTYIIVGNDGSSAVQNQNAKLYSLNSTGGIIAKVTGLSGNDYHLPSQSLSGEYKLIQATNGTITITKNNSILFQTVVDITHSFDNNADVVVSISPNGKYFGIFGTDFGLGFDRIQIWQGS